MPQMNEEFYKIILDNGWLTDDHINAFSRLLGIKFGYDVRESWMQMLTDGALPIPNEQKHIQLLHRLDGEYCDSKAGEMSGGHWVCSYYDTKQIFIYDSLNKKVLDVHFERFLRVLYPHYSFDVNPVIFPDVQQQRNSNDCGVFAIAFAVSLAFEEKPENLSYNVDLLRKHLTSIFQSNVITRFPTVMCQQSHSQNAPVVKTSNVNNAQLNGNNKRLSNGVQNVEPIVNKRMKRKTRKFQIPVLSEDDKNKISYGLKLNDAHMWKFGTLMSKFSDYIHCDTLLLQKPSSIEPIPVWKKHIQILHSSYDNHDLNHWVCSFYDSKKIYIYDSLNTNKLHPDHLKYLKQLYPFYDFDNATIGFPKVQNQQNSDDCGVFAIAFAVSLLFNQKPEHIKYDYSLMRSHLLSIFESNTIRHFPTILSESDNAHMPELQIVRKKEYDACRQRKRRYEQHILNAKRCKLSSQGITENYNKTPIEKCKSLSGNGNKLNDANEKVHSISSIENMQEIGYSCEYSDEKVMSATNASNVELPPYIINAFKRKNLILDRKLMSECDITDEDLTPHSNSKIPKISDDEKLEACEEDNIDVNSQHVTDGCSPDQKTEELSIKNYIFRTKLPVEKYIEELCMAIQIYHSEKKSVSTEKNCDGHGASQLELKNSSAHNMENVKSEENYIENKYDVHESRLIAEKIVKWSLHRRDSYVKDLTHLLRRINKKGEDTLQKLPVDKEQKIKTLCGDSLHTATSESYFYEMTYSFQLKHTAIIMNSEGKATNILPLLETMHNKKRGIKQWYCNDHCRIKIDDITGILDQYEALLNKLKSLNSKSISLFCRDMFSEHDAATLLGHPLSCYTLDKCLSLFTSVEVLSPHFPEVRSLKRLIYKLNHVHKKLFELDKLLETAHYEQLSVITDEVVKVAKTFYKDNAEICLDEEEIAKQNHAALIALTKRSSDTPHLTCISCRKLCCKSKGSRISKFRKPIDNKVWTDLLTFLDENDFAKSDFICIYCVEKFRKGIGPSICILNNLYVTKVPHEIATLNDYEKMLIQRAKAFQVVQRMGTVAKKNMPNHMKMQKVVGRTFYLPLPTEETLSKICPSTTAISDNQEFYILVNGLPTKANKVWQNLVDLRKVFHALSWLKKNNPHYAEILLPDGHEKLLEGVNFDDVEFQADEDDSSHNEKSLQKHAQKDHDSTESDNNITGKLNNLYTQQSDTSNCQDKPAGSPFLTQVRDRESYYENYTLYPLHNKRIAETATNLYQMKKVREKPLDNRVPILELLCFPELYPSGINGQHEERAIKLTDQSYVQLRLMSEDSRYRLNQQYIFHLLYETNVRQLNGGIYHALNIINPRHKYTAQGYLQQLKNGELEGNLNTIFERLRNSAAYWKTPRNNLNCMIRYYGPATWFLTLSPSEWLWTDLIKYIRDLNAPQFDKLSDNECIVRDPVSVSRFLDNKFHGMLNFLLSGDNPIGKISHYFWRREYQGRGTQHWHMVLWVEEAPIMGRNSNEDVRQFITKYVTCRLPNKEVSPVLYRRVNTHQRHNHNSYCLRKKKNNSGAVLSRCRFGFPRPATEDFVLREPAVSIAGRRQLKTKSRLYDLPRNADEVLINDYNPAILSAWEGNMDIQFIGENSTLLTQYCTKYATKFETATVSDSVHDINSTKSLRQRLWGFAFRSLNHREIGALEAVDTLLGIPLYGTDVDTTFRWLDVNIIRNRKLKARKDVEQLDPDSTEIFCPSLIDNHYPNRPNALESLSLYEFAKWYDIVKVLPKNEDVEIHQISHSLYLKRRSRAYLINHYRHNVNTYPENYFYALLLLYQPWRNTDELKNGFSTYTESFAAVKDILKDAAEYHKDLIDLQKGLENIKEQIEKLESHNNKKDEGDNSSNASNSDEFDIGEARKDFQDIADKAIADKNLPEMISQLNVDQARIFQRVQNALTSNGRPLRLCVSGEGGTGKSRLIDTIRCWIKEVLKKETAVTAPTGLAAFNINGLTAHRVFQLPVEHDSNAKYNEISDTVLKELRLQFKDTILIIIDEISMVSNIILLYINQRLIELFNTSDAEDGWFGGLHLLVFGDFLQLPPVRQGPVYETLTSAAYTKLMGSLGNINLWKELFSYDELRINMRQKTDQTYGDLLSRLRIGSVTGDDIKLLQERLIRIDISLSYSDRLRELCDHINKLPDDTVVLLPTCKQCDLLNFEMLKQIPSDEILLTADDRIDCPKNVSKKAAEILRKLENDSSNTAGLERVIVIKIDAKIMIRRNIDISLGLVNGTICRIISVSKSLDNGRINSITVRLGNGHEQIIERVSVKFQIMNGAYVMRQQFPISLSYGITIHKSQGLSLTNAVVDAGNSIFTCGQTYVALSRVTTLQGLHLINFDPHCMKVNLSAIQEYNRMRKIYRPDLPQIDIPHKRWGKVFDFPWAIPQQNPNPENDDHLLPEKVDWIIHGLQNNDGVYSYANSVLQCLFHCSLIRNCLLKKNSSPSTILETMLKTYMNNSAAIDLAEIRQFIGGVFSTEYEQDPALFLATLFSKIDDDMRNLVNVQRTYTIQCKRCNYVFNNTSNAYTLTVPLHSGGHSILLQKLIDDFYSHWHNYDGFCNECSTLTDMSRKVSIETVNDVVIIKLNLFTNKGDISTEHKKGFLKTIPTSRVTICNKIYTVVSGIFTCDETIHRSHWKSILKVEGKKSTWVSVDDQNIRKIRWPVNSRAVYVLFLQNTKAK